MLIRNDNDPVEYTFLHHGVQYALSKTTPVIHLFVTFVVNAILGICIQQTKKRRAGAV